jgi:hypothetical protein
MSISEILRVKIGVMDMTNARKHIWKVSYCFDHEKYMAKSGMLVL